MTFKVGDLVQIIKQSDSINNHIAMKGLYGYIEDISENGEYAQFVELNEKGIGGQGGVPISCLSLENDNLRLQELKKSRDLYLEKLFKEARDYSQRYNLAKEQAIKKASFENGVNLDKVAKIFDACINFQNEWNR